MCDNIVFHDGNEIAASQGHLAAIIGRENIVMDTGAEYHADDCLCPVNLASSASKAGYEQSRLDWEGEHDPFDCHWRKANDSKDGEAK